MAPENNNDQPVRVITGGGSLFTILLGVSAALLATAAGFLIYWAKDVYDFFLFWKQG